MKGLNRLSILTAAALSIAVIAAPVSANAGPSASASTLTPAKPAKCKKKKGPAKKKCLKKLKQAQQQQQAAANPGNQVLAGCFAAAKCRPTLNLNCSDCYTGGDGLPHHASQTEVHISGNLLFGDVAGVQNMPPGVPIKLTYVTLPGLVYNVVTLYTEANGNFHHSYISGGNFLSEYRTTIEAEFAGNATHLKEIVKREIVFDKKVS